MRLWIFIALALAGCENKREPIVQFPLGQCHYEWRVEHRTVRRQGACMVWTRVGEHGAKICTMYHHYNVEQQAQDLLCQRTDWRDLE